MISSSIASILEGVAAAGTAYGNNKAGSREALIDLSRALVAELEIPSEFIQRRFWAEPALSGICRLAVDINLFQYLKNAGDAGISPQLLSEKTGVDVLLLGRLMRHLVAMYLVTYHNGAFYGTTLSNQLAEHKYQDSISFCYDAARPSFNGYPEYFKSIGYKQPTSLTDGPFQAAHKTRLPFFEWLVATPPQLSWFDSFMGAYRAGKPNWYDSGFYPVSECLIEGFDANASDVLLVDVGGGKGHDLVQFAAAHASRPGKIILQDREQVIAGVIERKGQELPFEVQAHDFFTPQPVKAARAYSLHSILHDWGDDDSVRILENLKPALKPGYSKVLLNEIVLSEEHPTLAATSMDMMMLAHFAVRERTEADWKAILVRAGLEFCKIYTYPGVAESLIEAELSE